MIKTNIVESCCEKCSKWVKGKEYYAPFSLYNGDNYIFKCECGHTWEEED